jgi:ABC-type multidrug transport system fused ATPase/permease subunit
MFLAGLIESANLVAIYPVINYGLNQNSHGMVLDIFNSIIKLLGFKDYFAGACIVLLMITVLAVFFRFIYILVSFRLLANITLKNQNDLFNKLTLSNYDYLLFNFIKYLRGKEMLPERSHPAWREKA